MKMNQKGIGATVILITIVIVALLGTVGWLVYDRQKTNTDNDKATTETSTQETADSTQEDEPKMSYEGQKVTSGRDRFTIEIPQGWGELFRPTDSDRLVLNEGTKQPIYSAGKQVTVTDIPGFGSDGPRVFSVFVHGNVAPAEGTPSDFTLSNNGQPIEGTKYAITYTDTLEGLGGHEKGEKHYEYWFKLKDGNNLVVWYSVYNEDLNDQSSLIDEVVHSIVIKN